MYRNLPRTTAWLALDAASPGFSGRLRMHFERRAESTGRGFLLKLSDALTSLTHSLSPDGSTSVGSSLLARLIAIPEAMGALRRNAGCNSAIR